MATYSFDLDGTILETRLDDEKGYIVRYAKIEIIDLIRKLKNKGNVIIIQTGRSWKWFVQTKQQLDDYGIEYDSIICGNVVADYYINDKALQPEQFIKLMEAKDGE